MCEKEKKNYGWLQLPQCLCQHNERHLKLETKCFSSFISKGRYGGRGTWQLYNSKHKLTVISACSLMRQEADRQLQLSFDKTDTCAAAQRRSILHKSQTDCEISWFLSAFPPFIHALLQTFLLLNFAQIKIIHSWGYAKLTAYPSSLPCAAIFCS